MCGGRQARRCDTLEELLAAADVVSIHTTLDDDSHHMMNAVTFGQMKRGSYFVNAARGELVDEDAMVAALESGHLAGAGIDVGTNDVSPSVLGLLCAKAEVRRSLLLLR